MRIVALVLGWVVMCNVALFAQQNIPYDPLHAPDSYRSVNNPNYWKNKMPYPGYWQQDVYYNIKADIDEKTDIIDGYLELTYYNNSPDTLYEVFFHLYQNAFQPCAYYHGLQQENGVEPQYGPYESACLGTTIEYLRSNGQDLEQTPDNTILRVTLDEPMLPNSSKQFDIKFKTYFGHGNVRRRMKVYGAWGFKHFNGVHWHPRISVYDRKFGWTTDQHLGREFYGDFGTYDVELTFANNMIVEATGYLQNRDEVMPDSLRQKLDLGNFKDKPWGQKPSVIIPYDTAVHKTWKYHAENVHNFAFTADPTYRIGEVERNGVRSIALVQEPHASKWQEVAVFTADVVEVYERDFGKYGYHKMIVADAADGMEYPMLTLCSGSFPSNKGLIAHEVGHNWFYGMVGNNETYRAALDEGFTQFLTAWSLEEIDGIYVEPKPDYKGKITDKFKEREEIRNIRVYDGYIWDAVDGEDAFLNTHSDAFNGALRHGGGYRHVYYKTAVMLYNLQYVLGDSLFQDAMKHYFNQWSYAHPYFEDMRNSFTHYTKTDLNWFFDQWLETMKNIDYSVHKVKKQGKTDDGEYRYAITLKRKGRMQMPIDFSVVTDAGDTIDYYIPNTWFQKETDATVLPKWYGWDNLQPEYIAEITVPGMIQNVIIDRSQRLADVNMLNNSKKVPVDFEYDAWIDNRRDWRNYELKMRPHLWWNAYDGLKAGFNLRGNYLNYRHRFNLMVMAPTGGILQGDAERFGIPENATDRHDWINYRLDYSTRLDHHIQDLEAFFTAQYVEGYEMYDIGLTKFIRRSSITLNMKLMTRPQAGDRYYLLYPGYWNTDMINNTLNLTWKHRYGYKNGTGYITATLRSSALASDYNYHYLEIEKRNYTRFWKLELRTRFYGRHGTGKNFAPESQLFVVGANNEELMNYPLTRSIGYVPPTWVGGFGTEVNHFHMGGGLNLRGYAGYAIVETHDGQTYYAFMGNSGAAINAELDLDGIVKWQPKKLKDHVHLDVYLFGDAAAITYNRAGDQRFAEPRLDAGAGIALTLKNWGPFEEIKPLTLRFDVPFYISHAPAAEPDNVKFRWVVGLNRTF